MNHFIEIQQDGDGRIWVMIHSGSRNLGKQVADHYYDIAKELDEDLGIAPSWKLSVLPLDTPEGQAYLREMTFCVDFAYNNRALMMERVSNAFLKHTGTTIVLDEAINIAHNYAVE